MKDEAKYEREDNGITKQEAWVDKNMEIEEERRSIYQIEEKKNKRSKEKRTCWDEEKIRVELRRWEKTYNTETIEIYEQVGRKEKGTEE